jgi:hypothetical protein
MTWKRLAVAGGSSSSRSSLVQVQTLPLHLPLAVATIVAVLRCRRASRAWQEIAVARSGLSPVVQAYAAAV